MNVTTYSFDKHLDKYIAYHDSVFYIASQKSIYLLTIVDDFEAGSTKRITPKLSDIGTIPLEDHLKIHGLFLNYDKSTEDKILIVALETLDYQIDFNTLQLLSKSFESWHDYQFNQLREVVPRSTMIDPITKFVNVFDKDNNMFSLALRKSSKVDFYYNGTKVL